jgi:hypothetical protein
MTIDVESDFRTDWVDFLKGELNKRFNLKLNISIIVMIYPKINVTSSYLNN